MIDTQRNAPKPAAQRNVCAPPFPDINPEDFRLFDRRHDSSHAGIRSRLVVKRSIDCVVGLTATIVLLPIMIAISIAILFEERGPVFFSQKRVGRDRRKSRGSFPADVERRTRSGGGREFRMYKFRTMHRQSPKYGVSPTSDDDPRVTRTGRFLRKTSLDELPQLLNVLKGNMSLVGPRPEMPFIVAKYEPVHKTRLAVKPGITGLWQLRGPRDCFIHDAIEWDLHYIANWSLRLDFAILLETVVFALRARNR
jgi:lipopolysaccharide/colanic/teichoic acid biosynthesis glycosyltransferase